jgi:hypothetical protein
MVATILEHGDILSTVNELKVVSFEEDSHLTIYMPLIDILVEDDVAREKLE